MEEDYYYDITSDPSMYTGDTDALATAVGGMVCVVWVVVFVVAVIVMAGMWKIFTKAGKPGWAAIVPIYNIIVLLEIVARPAWWVVLFLIPVANIVASIITSIDLAKVFGKSTGYGLGLALVPYVFYPMLGFGNAQYKGAAVAGSSTPASTSEANPPAEVPAATA